jgi:ATP-binding cassette subfamily B protein
MKLLFPYLKKYKWLLVGVLVLATLNQGFSLLDPQLFRMMIDRYASHAGDFSHKEFISGILVLLGLSVGVSFLSRVAKNFQDYYLSVVTKKVGTELYAKSITHAFGVPYAVFEDERSGELLQKLQKARTDNETFIMSLVNTVFLSLIGIIFVLIYGFTVHWSIGLAYFLMIPLLGSTIYLLSAKIKDAQKNIVKETASLAGSTTETLRNVELVKSLGLEGQEIARLNTVNETILALELKKLRLIRALSFVQGTIINAVRAGLLFLMLWLVFQKTITVGQLFSLFIYSFYIFAPLGELGNVARFYQEAKASNEQVQKLLEIPKEKVPEQPVIIENVDAITFDNVSFMYETAEKETLQDINLKIKKGDSIAFVGPSGSGKTTLIKLLTGLYKVQKGTLAYNNTSILDIDLADLRGKIGLVAQETQLFAGTIRDNLVFVRQNATDEELLQALRGASALSIIERSPLGLDAKIGEGGIKISGGERQRLAIARALLRKPEVIIFDEATSALDSITEKSITDTIKDIEKEFPNTISIMIAHRLSTIHHAKHIVVLEKGKIIEQGTHDELVQQNGLYHALWREQSGENLL